jgi:hypothetical protein
MPDLPTFRSISGKPTMATTITTTKTSQNNPVQEQKRPRIATNYINSTCSTFQEALPQPGTNVAKLFTAVISEWGLISWSVCPQKAFVAYPRGADLKIYFLLSGHS